MFIPGFWLHQIPGDCTNFRVICFSMTLPSPSPLSDQKPSDELLRYKWLWPEDYTVPLILIGGFEFMDRAYELHGMKSDLSKATKDGEIGRGKVLEFVIDKCGTLVRLRQCGSVACTEFKYASLIYTKKASEVKNQLSEPKWKSKKEADWPHCADKPMPFLAQFDIPSNSLTLARFVGNRRVALFGIVASESEEIFAITSQEIKFQSADDHYKGENLRLNC